MSPAGIPINYAARALGVDEATLWDAVEFAGVKEFFDKGKPCFRAVDLDRIRGALVRMPRKRQWQIYIARRGLKGHFKIGVSLDPARRLMALQSANAEVMRLVHTEIGGHRLEREAHRALAAYRLQGEWFSRDPKVIAFVQSARAVGIRAAIDSTGQFT